MTNKIKNYINRILYCIKTNNIEVLRYGWNSVETSSYWAEKNDRARLRYALENPWVLQYNFGHKELIHKYINKEVL